MKVTHYRAENKRWKIARLHADRRSLVGLLLCLGLHRLFIQPFRSGLYEYIS